MPAAATTDMAAAIRRRRRRRRRTACIAPGTETAPRERLGDFYLYPLPERTTIADKQTKQVSFLDVAGAPAARGYEFRNGWLSTADQPLSANTVLRFSSSRAGGLGDALPAGIVRVYQRDARGNPQFVGEHRIGHTPMGSDIGLATGQAFDVKVRPVVEERHAPSNSQTVLARRRMRYDADQRRAPQAPVTVDLVQAGLWGDTRIVDESLQSERLSADEARWRVTGPGQWRSDRHRDFRHALLSRCARSAAARAWRSRRQAQRAGDRHLAGAGPGRGDRLSRPRPRARSRSTCDGSAAMPWSAKPAASACRRAKASCASKA